MTYKSHLALGFALSCSTALIPFKELNPFYQISNPIEISIIAGLIFISSLAPDFDEPGSYLSKRFPWFIISRILSLFTTHRGVTHIFIASIVYTLIILGIMLLVLKGEAINYMYMLSFAFLAYFSHSIGDSCTKGGVKRFFYPFSKSTFWILPKSMRFYTGSFIESIYFLLFSAIFAGELYYIFTNILPSLVSLSQFNLINI